MTSHWLAKPSASGSPAYSEDRESALPDQPEFVSRRWISLARHRRSPLSRLLRPLPRARAALLRRLEELATTDGLTTLANVPDLVDVATLTGACVVALASEAAGLFSNDDELARKLIECGERVGERLWRMPVWDEYKDLIRSEWADINQS